MFILKLILTISLIALFVQDLKYKMVNLFLLILTISLLFAFGYNKSLSFTIFIQNIITNVIVLFVMFLLIKLYYYLKYKKSKIIDISIGVGDVIFLIGTGFIFNLFELLIFIIFSSIFSILFILTIKLFNNKYNETKIPYLGISSLIIIFFIHFHKYLVI